MGRSRPARPARPHPTKTHTHAPLLLCAPPPTHTRPPLCAPQHREEIKATPFADLQSTGGGRAGGSCTAAAFLENFIGGAPAAGDDGAAPKPATPAWAHLDIAGPGMYSKGRGFMPAGGTGFGVALLYEYVANAPAGALAADPVRKY